MDSHIGRERRKTVPPARFFSKVRAMQAGQARNHSATGKILLKSRRDGLFIVNAVPLLNFLFFSGAGRSSSTRLEHNPRAAEKQKEEGFEGLASYKQAIP